MNDHELRTTAIGRIDDQNTATIGFDAKRVLAARQRGDD